MLEDVRSQLNQSKINHEADLSRLESRIMSKIDESQRNNEKYVKRCFKFDENKITWGLSGIVIAQWAVAWRHIKKGALAPPDKN